MLREAEDTVPPSTEAGAPIPHHTRLFLGDHEVVTQSSSDSVYDSDSDSDSAPPVGIDNAVDVVAPPAPLGDHSLCFGPSDGGSSSEDVSDVLDESHTPVLQPRQQQRSWSFDDDDDDNDEDEDDEDDNEDEEEEEEESLPLVQNIFTVSIAHGAPGLPRHQQDWPQPRPSSSSGPRIGCAREDADLFRLPYVGAVISHREPRAGNRDDEPPEKIWTLCFPEGLWLYRADELPRARVWSMTPGFQVIASERHASTHITVLVFYRPLPAAVFAPGTAARAAAARAAAVFVPVGLCVTTRRPCFAFCRRWLLAAYAELVQCPSFALADAAAPALRALFALRADNTAAGCRAVPVGGALVPCPCFPLFAALPPVSGPLHVLLGALGPARTVDVVEFLLNTGTVLLASASPAVLSDAVQAVRPLLYPFECRAPLVCVVPAHLPETVFCPAGGVFGLLPPTLRALPLAQLPRATLVCDLDAGTVALDRRGPDFVALPRPQRDALLADLAQARNLFYENDPLQDAAAAPAAAHARVAALETMVQLAFLRCFAALFCAYRAALVYLAYRPVPVALFDTPRFLQRSGAQRPFLRAFLARNRYLWMLFLSSRPVFCGDTFDFAVASALWDMPLAAATALYAAYQEGGETAALNRARPALAPRVAPARAPRDPTLAALVADVVDEHLRAVLTGTLRDDTAQQLLQQHMEIPEFRARLLGRLAAALRAQPRPWFLTPAGWRVLSDFVLAAFISAIAQNEHRSLLPATELLVRSYTVEPRSNTPLTLHQHHQLPCLERAQLWLDILAASMHDQLIELYSHGRSGSGGTSGSSSSPAPVPSTSEEDGRKRSKAAHAESMQQREHQLFAATLAHVVSLLHDAALPPRVSQDFFRLLSSTVQASPALLTLVREGTAPLFAEDHVPSSSSSSSSSETTEETTTTTTTKTTSTPRNHTHHRSLFGTKTATSSEAPPAPLPLQSSPSATAGSNVAHSSTSNDEEENDGHAGTQEVQETSPAPESPLRLLVDLLPDYPTKPRFSLPRNVVYVRLASEGPTAPLCGFEVLFSDGAVVQLGSTPAGTAVVAAQSAGSNTSASAPTTSGTSAPAPGRVTTATFALASDEYVVCVFGWQSSGSLLSLGFVTNQRRVLGPVGAPPAPRTPHRRRRNAVPPPDPSEAPQEAPRPPRPATLAAATTTTVSAARGTGTGSLPVRGADTGAARRRTRRTEAQPRAYNFQYVAAEDEYLQDLAIESTLRTVFNVFAPRSAVNAHVRARWGKIAPPDLSEDDEVGNRSSGSSTSESQ